MNVLYKLLLCILVYFFVACSYQQELHYHAKVVAGAPGIPEKNRYRSVQAAIDAAPSAAISPYKIYLSAGEYYEKLVITKPNIHLIGAGMDKTRLVFDAYAGQESTPGKTWGTRGSGTVIVRATDVQFHQLTIANNFDFIANDALANDDPRKVRDSQAVALHLDKGSDRVLVRGVKLLGYQDTLFVDAGRSWFDNSVIAGNVDFIFGAGNALFTDSEIVTRARGRASQPHAYVTAPSTQITDEFGLTFIRCRLTREAGVPDNSTPLGRPWHPTTQFADGRYADPNAIGKAVFIDSELGAHITQDGWYSMGGTTVDGGKKLFMPDDARFFEYRNHGPGAVDNPKRRQLSEDEAARLTPATILGDWNI
jgi:pectinesterase